MGRAIGNVVGFDDARFTRSHRGDVLLVDAVSSHARLDGVLSFRVVWRLKQIAIASFLKLMEKASDYLLLTCP